MLEKFGIMVLSEYLSEKEKEIVIRGFSDFYHQLTPKHQKRINLNWAEGLPSEDLSIKRLFDIYDISSKVLNKCKFKQRSEFMKSSGIMLHPSDKHLKTIVPEAFSFGLPILSINGTSANDYIDVSCGMLMENNSIEQLVVEITTRLDMLYHDQEVLKLLEKGAYDQYEKKFGWGLKEFRRPLF